MVNLIKGEDRREKVLLVRRVRLILHMCQFELPAHKYQFDMNHACTTTVCLGGNGNKRSIARWCR